MILAEGYYYPASIYLFIVNNGNTKAMCYVFSKLTVKTHIFETGFSREIRNSPIKL